MSLSNCQFWIKAQFALSTVGRVLYNLTHLQISRPVDYTEENLRQALDHQAHLEANFGGTELYPALKSVYDTPPSGEGWYRQIVLLTDGEISDQELVCLQLS